MVLLWQLQTRYHICHHVTLRRVPCWKRRSCVSALDPGLELPSARHLTHGIGGFTHLKPSKYNINGEKPKTREKIKTRSLVKVQQSNWNSLDVYYIWEWGQSQVCNMGTCRRERVNQGYCIQQGVLEERLCVFHKDNLILLPSTRNTLAWIFKCTDYKRNTLRFTQEYFLVH